MTMLDDSPVPDPKVLGSPTPGSTMGGYLDGIAGVVGMELRQRLRSRGWYVMLIIWFVLIGIVTTLAWLSWTMQAGYEIDPGFGRGGPGPLIFEAVLAFVLLFGLLVAPALSANAISGDRAGGTLAILQVTLLRPGQLLWGKFLASWIAALVFLVVSVPFLIFGIAQGGLGVGRILVALLMLAVELGVVCALGVGISALANRPLFSIVVSYLSVAVLTFGTLIAFGLGALLSNGSISVNQTYYKGAEMYQYDEYSTDDLNGDGSISDGSGVDSGYSAPSPSSITDENADYACYGPLSDQPASRTERVAWMLGMNPFVVVADAIPYPGPTADEQQYYSPAGFFEAISQGARYAQAGPEGTYQCANGKVVPDYVGKQAPLWPLGLGLQLCATAIIMALGWRSLRTPAGKLPKGTRVA